MKRIIINLAVMLALSVSGVYAHGPEGEGHAPKPEITENQARAKATQSVAVIVKDGKLDASWSKLEPSEAQKNKFQTRTEWVVTFNNPEYRIRKNRNCMYFSACMEII